MREKLGEQEKVNEGLKKRLATAEKLLTEREKLEKLNSAVVEGERTVKGLTREFGGDGPVSGEWFF